MEVFVPDEQLSKMRWIYSKMLNDIL